MTLPIGTTDPTFRIYMALAQYPILQTRLRRRMRRELYNRGIITTQELENQVREQAIHTQQREGISDPYGDEPEEVWIERLGRVRANLTDIYFAHNLSFELFNELVKTLLAESGADINDPLSDFNPELSTQEMLFEQAIAIQKLPRQERQGYEARLKEIQVVLMRSMISDQLAYLNIAKEWLDIEDLLSIRRRKIGKGKIGGKSAGMLLAQSILEAQGDEDITESLHIPRSYFLGADVMYSYMSYNNLMHWADQKYKSADQMHAEYPQIQEEYMAGEFPPDIATQIENILLKIGKVPIIVRSSSLLEDNFGTSFAGKYESFFCPNQGTRQENFRALWQAIVAVYASALNPDALLYRRAHKLQDYDERIAILIQVVQGQTHDRYFYPQAAGVAFSRNLYRWSQKIRREDGFLRLVWGMGTRAVDRVGNDYPRLVALSHPLLRAEATPKEVHRYSQHFVDVIDLEDNEFKSLPVQDVLDRHDPALRYIVQLYKDDYLSPLRSTLVTDNKEQLVITLEELLRRTPLAEKLRTMLQILEKAYHSPVDVEFTARIRNPEAAKPDIDIYLLQCRPQSHYQESSIELPENLAPTDVIFSTSRVIPHGQVQGIRYVLFVSPEGYYSLPSQEARAALRHGIGHLNEALKGETFICVGPGRWGTTNPDLGVRIGYADIHHTKALVEISGEGVGTAPEASFGTHFFQDLIESQIYPLAVYLDDDDSIFNRDFFYETPNSLAALLPQHADLESCLRLIEVSAFRPGHQMELVMDDEAGKAIAYLTPIEENPA